MCLHSVDKVKDNSAYDRMCSLSLFPLMEITIKLSCVFVASSGDGALRPVTRAGSIRRVPAGCWMLGGDKRD